MPIDSSIVSVLPNLSVGVASIAALVFVTVRFLQKLDSREAEMRALEKEVRTSIMEQLGKNSSIMQRVIDRLDVKTAV